MIRKFLIDSLERLTCLSPQHWPATYQALKESFPFGGVDSSRCKSLGGQVVILMTDMKSKPVHVSFWTAEFVSGPMTRNLRLYGRSALAQGNNLIWTRFSLGHDQSTNLPLIRALECPTLLDNPLSSSSPLEGSMARRTTPPWNG